MLGLEAALKYIKRSDIRNLKTLLDENPNILTTNGTDLLHAALNKNNQKIIEYMLEKGTVDLNSSSKNGKKLLEIAATILCDKNITKILLSQGADPCITVDEKPILFWCNKVYII